MIRVGCLAVAFALAGCAAIPPVSNARMSPPEQRWAPKTGVRLCHKLAEAKTPYNGCRIVHGSFLAIGNGFERIPGALSLAYRIRTEAGEEGYISDVDYLASATAGEHRQAQADAKAARAAKAACDRKGGIGIGMTEAQVYASCWGKPRTVNRTILANGNHDQLVYGGGNYVYLTNGIVTAIQTGQ